MCGIAGLWAYGREDIADAAFDAFLDSVSHRGPDGRGVMRERAIRLSLGHRRLAILDLSPAGRQPMSYGNGRYWITFNGEVFNFLELREELEGLGHRFKSESDTEVILASFAQWGEDCQLRFNGMWGLAIWDNQERRLFLSRDRFGIKPLMYISTDEFFAFASEMKAFLHLPCYKYELDEELWAETLTDMIGLEGTEWCLLKGVKRLLGGHCLTLTAGRPPAIRQWWRTLDHLPRTPNGFAEQAAGFKELFFDACRLRMRSDVPVATSLSGGLDSSSVLSALYEINRAANPVKRAPADWQRAFVACYPGTNLDEEKYARVVIEAKSATPVYQEIRIKDCLDRLEDIIYQFEELYAVLQAGLWLNYKAMRDRDVVVSLDGHGADELLGGYLDIVQNAIIHTLYPWPQWKRYRDLMSTAKGFRGGSNPGDVSFLGMMRIVARKYRDFFIRSFIGQQLRKIYRLYRYGLNPATTPPASMSVFLRRPLTQSRLLKMATLEKSKPLADLSPLNRELYIHFHHTTLPTILRHFDRASMGHGVEIRMPFMDWRLVCYAFALPDESKIGQGYAKLILRQAMQGIIPEEIRLRTNKIGFTSPMPEWFKGPLKNFLMDTAGSQAFLNADIWDGREVLKFIQHVTAADSWSSLGVIWPYLNAHILISRFAREHSAMRPLS